MTDISDLPAIIETMGNKEKLAKISFIIKSSCAGLITFDEVDLQIDRIIHSEDDDWEATI